METADKYTVLEFLVKELIGMRKDMVQQPVSPQWPTFPPSGAVYTYDDGRRSMPVAQSANMVPSG